MYSFEQLKIFVRVYEEGSFSAAARKLGRAQSGVSQAIANLEIALDAELFMREKNSISLTPIGQSLLPIARSLLNQKEYFDQKLEALGKNTENHLVIAIDECLASHEFLDIFSQIPLSHPTTTVEIHALSSLEVEEAIRTKRAQIGILFLDDGFRDDMDFFVLKYMRFITVAAPDHKLASLPMISDSVLKAHRQIVYRTTSQKELWFSYGIGMNQWYANSHSLLVKLACRGVGWAVIPAEMAEPLVEEGRLVALPVTHAPKGWLANVSVLVSRSHSPGPVLNHLLQSLQVP